MRIYVDSNIFRKLKKSSGQFHPELFDSVEKIRKYFLFLFSEAHLHDLSKSTQEYRNEDLILMEEYTRNNYLKWDPIKKKFQYLLATPTDAYQSIDFRAFDAVFTDPATAYRDLLGLDELGEEGEAIRAVFDMPLFDIDSIIPPGSDAETMKAFNVFHGVRSINDFLAKMPSMNGMLEDKKEFRKYQKLIDTYIDRNEYSYEHYEDDFDSRMKNTLFGQTFSEMVDTISIDKNDEHNRFLNFYVQLEAFGVTQERSGKKQKLKENSHWDLRRDAMHAYYGSFSDYFVSDDSGLLSKAFITYKAFGFQTQVLSVKDFIARSAMLLKNEDSIHSFVQGISYTIKKGFVISQSIMNDQMLIKLPYPIFNYFNRLQINHSGESSTLQLFKSYEISYGIMYAEIQLLIEKCSRLFGPSLASASFSTDLEKFKEFDYYEPIAQWSVNNQSITLIQAKNTLGQDIISLSVDFDHA